MRRFGCTYFNYVGKPLSYVLAQPEQPDDADNPLDVVPRLGGVAARHAGVPRRFGCFVAEGYGSSEGAVVITPFSGMPPGALGRPAEGRTSPSSTPRPASSARARFDEDGRLLNPDEAIGEIVGRGALSAFEGYYANPEATAERSRDGWYWTGDLGYRDEDGTFYFAGRTADWLRVDGENFAAGPVERILGRFPGVASVVVYGVPDPRTGDQVMAALELEPAPPSTRTAFAAFLAEQPDLGTKWAPRFVRVVERDPGHRHRQGRPQAAAGRALDDRRPGVVAAGPGTAYQRLTDDDVADLREAFRDAGRDGMLA